MTRTKVDDFAAIIARILLGSFFILSGLANLTDISSTAQQVNLPAATFLVFLGGCFKFFLGIMLVARYHTKYAALALAVYLLSVSLIFYGPPLWSDDNVFQFIFVRNLAIVGGLLFIYAHSRGYKDWIEEWISPDQRALVHPEWKDKNPPP